ncbi:fibronectin type III domain-containing protein [Streptomyces sp. NPDC059816]|uniref:fibronectin type III domain-containing protein n=1 Tax=Streptomyces sp. NPDC059816 TaxID=3346960 RepID=UPI00366208FB
MTTVPPLRRPGRALLGTALATALLSGCSDGASPSDGRSAAPRGAGVTLSAKLDTPTDVTLRWSGDARDAAGQVVEFATEPEGAYTTLRFAPEGQRLHEHPDLMPETPFYYRLRAYGGPVSAAVELDLPKGAFSKEDQRSGHEWAAPRKLSKPGSAAERHPVRGEEAVRATADDFKATVKHANGVLLTWRDRARDEAGYLVEIRPAGAPDFHVAAVLDPDIESTGLITLPREKRATVRVRAFFYGERSNVVLRTTGKSATG